MGRSPTEISQVHDPAEAAELQHLLLLTYHYQSIPPTAINNTTPNAVITKAARGLVQSRVFPSVPDIVQSDSVDSVRSTFR